VKGAIASVEIFAHRKDRGVRRLTLVIEQPRRGEDAAVWRCRVALADLRRPVEIVGPDAVDVLTQALGRGRSWLKILQEDGFALYRDRAGKHPYPLD
jgi:hypothetical protein